MFTHSEDQRLELQGVEKFSLPVNPDKDTKNKLASQSAFN